ncbi:uncharacterized protein LOC120337131 [Styela clava]
MNEDVQDLFENEDNTNGDLDVGETYAITMDGESQGRILRIQPFNTGQEKDKNDEQLYQGIGEYLVDVGDRIEQKNESQATTTEELGDNENSSSVGIGNSNQTTEIVPKLCRKSGRLKKSSKIEKSKLESIADRFSNSEMGSKTPRRKRRSKSIKLANSNNDAELAEGGDTFVLVVSDSDDDLPLIPALKLKKQLPVIKSSTEKRKKDNKTNKSKAHSADQKRSPTSSKKSKTKINSCPICKINFTSDKELKLHKVSHAQEKPHSCDVCGKAFLTSTDVLRHSVVHSQNRKTFVPCTLCPRKFLTQTNLDLHLRVHAGERPYCCNKCNMGFTQQGHLIGHMKTHLEIKPHACSQGGCTKTFARRADLTNHIRTHTGEKPFLCTICGKCFAQRGHMENHFKIHLGVKPHNCDICSKPFSRKADVTRHMRIHTGVKPYVCEICGRGFAQSSQYKTHSRVHTGAKPYSCEKCQRRFTQSANRKKHMRNCKKGANTENCENSNSGMTQNTDNIDSFQKLLNMDLLTTSERSLIIEAPSSSNEIPEKEPNGLKDKVQIPAEYVNEKCSLPRVNINETDCVNSGDPPVIMRCNLTKIWSNERIKSKRKSCSGNNHDKVGIESKNDANTTKITKGYCEQQENSEISSSRRFALTKYKQHELRSDTKPCEAPSESSEYYKTWEKKFKRKLGNIDAKTKSNKFDLSFAVKKKRINNKIQTREFVQKECEYFCDACGRMYNSFECLKCHIRAVHFRKDQIICEICNQTFMWKSDLKLHEDTEHPEFSDKRFSCSLCRKRFHTRQQLDMHIRSHNEYSYEKDGNEHLIAIKMSGEIDQSKNCNAGVERTPSQSPKDPSSPKKLTEVSTEGKTRDSETLTKDTEINSTTWSATKKRKSTILKNQNSFSRKKRLEMAVKRLRMTQESLNSSNGSVDVVNKSSQPNLPNDGKFPSQSLLGQDNFIHKDSFIPSTINHKNPSHTPSKLIFNANTNIPLNLNSPFRPLPTCSFSDSEVAADIFKNFNKLAVKHSISDADLWELNNSLNKSLHDIFPLLPNGKDLIVKAATDLIKDIPNPLSLSCSDIHSLIHSAIQNHSESKMDTSIDSATQNCFELEMDSSVLKSIGKEQGKTSCIKQNDNVYLKSDNWSGETSKLLNHKSNEVISDCTHSGEDCSLLKEKGTPDKDEKKESLLNYLAISNLKSNQSPSMVLSGGNGASFANARCSILNKYKNITTSLSISKLSDSNEANTTTGSSNGKPYVCPICGKSYLYSTPFTSHLTKHMEPNGHSCKYCGKIFNFQSHLMRHLRVHTGEKPFSCVLCDKDFTDQGHLKSHIKAHRGEKSFACEECGKRFLKQSDVNRHMRVHTGEKPYCCMTCGKFFSRQTNLQSHMRTHTGERPYECEICGNAFGRKDTLLQHRVMHTGDKQFACEECGKRFVKRSDVTRHMRTHERHKYNCLACGKHIPKYKTKITSKSGQPPPLICDACTRTFSTASAVMKDSIFSGPNVDENATSVAMNSLAFGLSDSLALMSSVSGSMFPFLSDKDWGKHAATEHRSKSPNDSAKKEGEVYKTDTTDQPTSSKQES